VKLSIKRCVAALAGLFALGWSAIAAAQATTITTTCPTNFICAFSAAETMSLVTTSPSKPGQPDVYVGYIAFQGSTVTMTGQQNVNGTVGAIGTPPPGSSVPLLMGSCADGANGQPAVITFPGNGSTKTQLSFVKNSANTELQFILTQDINSSGASSANSIRIGVCRQ
jgi:hypothetical protein